MLKDYVAAQEALIDLAAKLKAMQNESLLIDNSFSKLSLQNEETQEESKLVKCLMQENIFLSEKIKTLNTSIVGGCNSTRQSIAPEPIKSVPKAQFVSKLTKY